MKPTILVFLAIVGCGLSHLDEEKCQPIPCFVYNSTTCGGDGKCFQTFRNDCVRMYYVCKYPAYKDFTYKYPGECKFDGVETTSGPFTCNSTVIAE